MSEMNDNDESLELESLIELIPIHDLEDIDIEEGILFPDDVDKHTIAEEHPYIKHILDSSQLYVLQEHKVKSNYEKYGIGGLF